MQVLNKWDEQLPLLGINDIQFSESYASLYGKPCMYLYKDNEQYAFAIIIINEEYNDFETPYGYGGFQTNSTDVEFINQFFSKLKSVLNDKSVIAGIIRFHPMHNISTKAIDVSYIRNTVIVNCSKYSDNKSNSCKSMIKRGFRHDMHYYFSDKIDDQNDFISAYSNFLKDKSADPNLIPNDDYYHNLFALPMHHLAVCRDAEGAFVGGASFLISRDMSYYHLSYSKSKTYPGISNVLLDMGIKRAIEMHSKYVMLGGGITDKKDDSLLRFKLSFCPDLYPFSIGKMTIDMIKYRTKTDEYDKNKSKYKNYFLRYRYDE